MSFRELEIRQEYRTFDDDIINEFYIPILKQSKIYKRAVGFFTSSVLVDISIGLCGLVKNGGKIQLIVSPKLKEEDIEAINKGYKNREKVVSEAIEREMLEPKNIEEEDRYNLLAHLIESGILDIKVALISNESQIGMYHEKVGILKDLEGDTIAFAGSMNETKTALNINYECIDVYTSWEEQMRVEKKEAAFDTLWNNMHHKLQVINFPEICIQKLMKYQKKDIDLTLDDKGFKLSKKDSDEKYPRIPSEVKFYEYQKEAISNWSKQGFRGIFDMATGTGKTYTALGAISSLSKVLDYKIFVVIVCPYTHLVTQWIEDIEQFNMRPIVAFSGGPDKYWKRKLELEITSMNLGKEKFACFVTTNKTFSSDFVQQQINRIKGDVLLVADEVHNLGATVLQQSLNRNIVYRLGLSATLHRHRDELGTEVLNKYFGEKCIEYTLDQAIEAGYLTRYYYYPIVVNLEEDELRIYKDLSKKLAKCCSVGKNGKIKLTKMGELIALRRARVVAAAKQKITKLREIMEDKRDESHMLVYCGDSRIIEDEESVEKQIDRVCKMLNEELGIRSARFTYTETANDRQLIKKEFESGEYIKAIVAIKCLDEGVNIPKIRKAFILASSTNPKEYIQRRGRVLRKFPGKEYAYIYDFITLPRCLEEARWMSEEEKKADTSLIKKEIQRIQEFARLSENYYDSLDVINEIEDIYNIYELEE